MERGLNKIGQISIITQVSTNDSMLAEIEDLYRRRHSAFLRVARAITGSLETAADAVQDGFADAIRSRRTYRREAPLEGWVWRIVMNAARRSQRPTEALLIDEPSVSGATSEMALELAPLVSSLPERQRLALFLRYYADLDYRAIAEALDIEVGTVSATLASAHQTIRRAVEEMTQRA